MSEKEGCTQGLVNYATIWHFWHLWQELLLRWRVLCSTRTCWPCWRACSAVAWSLPLLPSAGRATSTACLASEPLSTVPPQLQLILPKSGSRRGWTAAGSASRRSWTHRTRRWRRWSGWSDCRASTGQEAAQSSSFYPADFSMRPSAGHKKTNDNNNNKNNNNNNRKQQQQQQQYKQQPLLSSLWNACDFVEFLQEWNGGLATHFDLIYRYLTYVFMSIPS